MNKSLFIILSFTFTLFEFSDAVSRKGIGVPCSDTAFWKNVELKPGVISKAEEFNNKPVPAWDETKYRIFVKNGSRNEGEKMMYARQREGIIPLVIAECQTNSSKYIKKIEEYLNSLCDQPTWVFAAHDKNFTYYKNNYFVDLNAAEIAANLGQIYYMLEDKLSNATKQKIENTLEERVFKPMRRTFPYKSPLPQIHDWWYKGSTNWNAVCWSGVVAAALPLIRNETERDLYVKEALIYGRNYLKSFELDGYGSEGVSYFNYAFSNFILLRQLIMEATNGKKDLFQDPANSLPRTIDCALSCIEFPMTDKSVAHFGDDKFDHYFNQGIVDYVRSAFLKNLAGPRFANSFLWDSFLGEVIGYNLRIDSKYRFQAPEQKDFPSNNLRKYYNVSGILVARPANKQGLSATFKLLGGGIKSDGGHNHDDVGSYSIDLNGVMVAGEVGGPELYNSTTFDKLYRYDSALLNSYGHPVPFINGLVQKRNWLFNVTKPSVVSYTSSDLMENIVFDMKNAYDVSELKDLKRNMTYMRTSKTMVVVQDKAIFTKPSTFETAIVSKGTWKEIKKTSSSVTGTLELNQQVVQVQIISTRPFNLKADNISSEYNNIFNRIAIQIVDKVTDADVSVTYSP